MQDIDAILNDLDTNGVECGLKELIRYRPLAQKLNLKPASAIRNSMAGGLVSRFKGRGMEFDEARHYQPGDDIRSIDWRVTARTGKTHTKLYREERERPVLIYIDLQASMYFGSALLYKSVQALHAASLIAFSALSRGDKVGCMVVTESNELEIKPKSNAKHTLAMLNQMIQMQQTGLSNSRLMLNEKSKNSRVNQKNGLSQLAMLAKPGSLVYVISDFTQFNEDSFTELGRINRHCEVKPLRVYDPMEVSLPHVNQIQDVLVTDGKREQQLILGDKNIENAYTDSQQKWFNTLKQQLSKAGLRLRQVNSAMPIEGQLLYSKGGLILGDEA